jgi:hypothetical protein
MARRRDFEKATAIAKVKKAKLERYLEQLFGKLPKHRSKTIARKNPSKEMLKIRESFEKTRQLQKQAKRDAEAKARIENAKKKHEKSIERLLEGDGAIDLVFTAIHPGKVDYAKILAEEWRFDSEGVTMYFNQAVMVNCFAEKSEYLCLGFPRKIIDLLQVELSEHLKTTPNSILRLERILVDRLSRISLRIESRRISDSTIRQVFKLKKKALKKAQLLWPEIYKYK